MTKQQSMALCGGLTLAALNVRQSTAFVPVGVNAVPSRAGPQAVQAPAEGVAQARTPVWSVGATVAAAGFAAVVTKSAPKQRRALRLLAALAKEDDTASTDSSAAKDKAVFDAASTVAAPAAPAPPARKILSDEDLFKNDGVKDDVFNIRDQVGVCAPFGFFDPAGFSAEIDYEEFKRLRSSEIKHGRVCMMASIGGVAEHFIRLPFLGFEETSPGIINNIVTPPGTYAWSVLLIVIAFFELGVWEESYDRQPGDYGDPFGFTQIFPYDFEMRNRELNNGRAAMFAATGILLADFYTGKDGWEQLQAAGWVPLG